MFSSERKERRGLYKTLAVQMPLYTPDVSCEAVRFLKIYMHRKEANTAIPSFLTSCLWSRFGPRFWFCLSNPQHLSKKKSSKIQLNPRHQDNPAYPRVARISRSPFQHSNSMLSLSFISHHFCEEAFVLLDLTPTTTPVILTRFTLSHGLPGQRMGMESLLLSSHRATGWPGWQQVTVELE